MSRQHDDTQKEELPFCSRYFQVKEKGRTYLCRHSHAMLRAAQELHQTNHQNKPINTTTKKELGK
jgi:hypothetical protein